MAGEENREKALEMAVSQIEKRFWICPKGMTVNIRPRRPDVSLRLFAVNENLFWLLPALVQLL